MYSCVIIAKNAKIQIFNPCSEPPCRDLQSCDFSGCGPLSCTNFRAFSLRAMSDPSIFHSPYLLLDQQLRSRSMVGVGIQLAPYIAVVLPPKCFFSDSQIQVFYGHCTYMLKDLSPAVDLISLHV